MDCRRSPKLVSPYFFLGITQAIVPDILDILRKRRLT
jgi:hypothetical protein